MIYHLPKANDFMMLLKQSLRDGINMKNISCEPTRVNQIPQKKVIGINTDRGSIMQHEIIEYCQ